MSTTNTRISINQISILTLVLCLFSSVFTNAQSTNYTKSTADSNTRGSLEVDPSTLGMSFNMPMGGYGGRGATLPISLTYSSKIWRIQHFQGFPAQAYYANLVKAKYAEKSVSGWTTSTGVPYIEYTGQEQAYDWDVGEPLCIDCVDYNYQGEPFYVGRLLLHLPDGSTHELRKSDTQGNATSVTYNGIFTAVDGSRIKYNADISTIYLPDGSRYWLSAPNGVQYFDRNGNTLTYNTTSNQWTDTLGRVINAIPLSNSTVGYVDYLIPGVGGVNQKYTLRWQKLGETGVMTFSEPLRFTGNRKYGYQALSISPSLFQSGDLSQRIVDTGIVGYEHNPVLLTEIILPNSTPQNVLSYKFTYNVFGEIDKIVLPSGGYERFEYATVPSISDVNTPYSKANRGAIKHWISATGNSVDEVQWNYASTGTNTSVTNPSGSKAERTLLAASGNTHYGFEDSRAGRATEERTYNASNQLIRRSLVDWIQDGPLPGGHAEATRNPRPTKKVEIILDTTGNPLAAVTIPTFDADLNEIKSEHYDYTSVSLSTAQTAAIGSFTAGTLIRTTETTYLVNDTSYSQAIRDAYRARNMLGLPTKKIVKNAAGQIIAAAEFKYDEAAYPLLTYAGAVTGYTDPATTYRGNVTTTRNWNNNGNATWPGWTSGMWIEVHAQYDQFGSPRKSWDGKGNLAQVDYTDAFDNPTPSYNPAVKTYAYPNTTISPIPDTAGTYGANTTLNVQTRYDFSTGKVTWVQDANNQVATTEYESAYPPVVNNCCNSLNRLKRVVSPAGGGETTYEYNDVIGNMWVKTRKLRAAGVWLESVSYVDKIGRAWLSASNEGGNIWSVSETKYDNQGRAYQGSNPYRVTATSADTVPAAAASYTGKVWTTSTFDALNRVLTITTPDNAVVATNYNGNQVTVTDQAGKQRRSESDAMGRLMKVWEAPNSENYLTTYKYDALDSLVQVTQGTQNRYFLYDSIKRLLRARNPEQIIHTNHNLTDPFANTTNTQWSLAYTYDANSNLLTKTDSRNATAGQAPVTTTFTYDNLNRNTFVSYSIYQNGTASVERHYDTAPLGKGKFHWNAKYNTESDGTYAYHYDFINGYDAVGRPTSKTQKILYYQGGWATKDFTTSVTYDLASNILSQTYPSGRVVNYAYDAAGRTTDFTGNLGGTQRNYATNMKYDEASHLIKETFGTTTPLHQRFRFNIRQQLYDVRVGTNVNDEYSWDRGALEFLYGSAGWGGSNPDNNGNIIRSDHWIPDANGNWNSTTYDYYGYDGLNRVSSTSEYTNSSSNTNVTFKYTQGFLYDQWGNRRIDQTTTTTSPNINKKDYTINGATNQLGVPAGQLTSMSYDDVGNLILDTYTSGLTAGMQYDADNKMTSAANGGQQYRYNADGKRVKRIITGAGGGQYWMVYGIGGELVAEYNATSGTPAVTNPSKEYGYRGGQMLIVAESTTAVKWLVQDHLGSTRMEIATGGAIGDVTRHDYLPFGEELAGSMRVGNGYGGATNTKQKFTGYERDTETGLDYAQARYMSSVQGRFTSVDPDGVGAAKGEPQSWNGYTYVGNRPITLTDPSGLLWLRHNNGNGTYDVKWTDDKTVSDADVAAGWEKVTDHVYFSTSNGWVHLNPWQNDYTSGHASREAAENSGPSMRSLALETGDMMLGVLKGIGQIPGGLAKDFDNIQSNPSQFLNDTAYSLNGILPTIPSLSVVSAPEVIGTNLTSRVNDLSNLLPKIVRERFVTTAVLEAQSVSGATHIIVASSKNALPAVQGAALRAGEIGARGIGHAEITALETAKALGLRPISLAVSRPICTTCAPVVIESGVKVLTQFK